VMDQCSRRLPRRGAGRADVRRAGRARRARASRVECRRALEDGRRLPAGAGRPRPRPAAPEADRGGAAGTRLRAPGLSPRQPRGAAGRGAAAAGGRGLRPQRDP
ncbi:unnamed protein product, partial [Prorocentrum cordatum]